MTISAKKFDLTESLASN